MLLDFLDNFTPVTPYAPTAVATANNGVWIDRIIPMDDGTGEDINFVVYVTTAVTSAGAATVQFQLLGNATDSTFSGGNVVLCDSGAIAKATLVAGYRFIAKVPRNSFAQYEKKTSFLRYFAFSVTIGTAVLTAGAFNAWITHTGVQDNLSYTAGYTV